ncbi:hypothetical protein QYE76_028888 [Lolium multiflorum]|uniref:Uncharacterized protein n=1 Tax=Lolium multiflorum TaxID=4521 RepID=A0AAD8QMT4_LOLMU|nr:hypothetical protein QYE76_028888 [Lolium multiflorum]
MAESSNANAMVSGLKVSDILLPHPSLPNSMCLGPRSSESPAHLISCEANRIPFANQNLDLTSWADCLRAWPNPPEASRAELPDILTGQRCYTFFDALAIPIPHNLRFTTTTDGFDTWWSMWKTHAFRRALGPLLRQLDAEYSIPAHQEQDGPEPTQIDGSPFTFFPPAPVVLFCQNSPALKKINEISSGDDEEVPMPSATLGLAASTSAVGPVANLAQPTAQPIVPTSAAPPSLGEGCDPSSLLTFDPESIEPAAPKANEGPSLEMVHGPLQRLKALLSSSIEILVENPEAIKELETLRKELESLEEKVRMTKQLIQEKEAFIARSREEAQGLTADLKTDLAEIRELSGQLVTGKDEDDEAEIAEVDRIRADALRALDEFLQKNPPV